MAKGYNWEYIKALYEQGALPAEISARMGGLPKATLIERRSMRESWSLPGNLPTQTSAKDPSVRVAILDALRQGSTLKGAAALAGIVHGTLHNWRKQDPVFKEACNAAQAEWAQRQIDRIDKAGDKDWKAASWLLQSHPATREEFAPAQAKGAGGINIVLNIPRTLPESQGIKQIFGAIPMIDRDSVEDVEVSDYEPT